MDPPLHLCGPVKIILVYCPNMDPFQPSVTLNLIYHILLLWSPFPCSVLKYPNLGSTDIWPSDRALCPSVFWSYVIYKPPLPLFHRVWSPLWPSDTFALTPPFGLVSSLESPFAPVPLLRPHAVRTRYLICILQLRYQMCLCHCEQISFVIQIIIPSGGYNQGVPALLLNNSYRQVLHFGSSFSGRCTFWFKFLRQVYILI